MRVRVARGSPVHSALPSFGGVGSSSLLPSLSGSGGATPKFAQGPERAGFRRRSVRCFFLGEPPPSPALGGSVRDIRVLRPSAPRAVGCADSSCLLAFGAALVPVGPVKFRQVHNIQFSPYAQYIRYGPCIWYIRHIRYILYIYLPYNILYVYVLLILYISRISCISFWSCISCMSCITPEPAIKYIIKI